MPIEIRQQLIDDLMKRQVEHDTANRTRVTAPPIGQGRELDPSLLLLLGAAADGATTANFLRGTTHVEDNAMFRGLNGNPLTTGLAVAGTGVATVLAHKLLARKLPHLAKMLTANQAAERIGLAGRNISPDGRTSGNESLTRSITQAIRRTHVK